MPKLDGDSVSSIGENILVSIPLIKQEVCGIPFYCYYLNALCWFTDIFNHDIHHNLQTFQIIDFQLKI